MRVIITGIAGFIGSHVAEEMLHSGWEVAGIDDLSGGFIENVPSQAQFFNRDCCANLEDIFQSFQPQVVIHLAAYAAEGLSHHIPNFNYQNNVVGTTNVLAAAYRAGAKHFVFTSSIAAYGHPPDEQPLRESTPCHPCDPYGIAKLACEQHIAAFHDYYGGPTYTIFRPHNVFGPRQNIADPYRNVVGIFFRCARQGRPLPVFGDGSQTRSFSYIDVVARCIAQAAGTREAVNEVFNVGGDQSLSVHELAQAVAEVTGTDTGIEHLAPRQEVQHAHADHLKVRKVFPTVFEEAISLTEGLHLMADFVAGISIPAATACPSEIEIADRLPASWRSSGGA
ncbi:MAG: NAD-dependent epimerase/dehydratase family protein [Planctomycetales bacterium]|nr:NAD-dependent epimerase/dehydratase family protein [Planctomycetales bacterium]